MTLVRGHRIFADTADPDVFYPSPIHESVCAELFAAAKSTSGLLVLTGEPGTGKTAVLRRVARDLEGAGGRVLWGSAAEDFDAMVASLIRQLGAASTRTPDTQRETLLAALRAHDRRGGANVVAVDESQGLEPAQLEGLHGLAEAGAASGVRLAVLLVGQPGLDVKLASLAGAASGAIYTLRLVLPRLAASEVGPYVAYQLRQAGVPQDDVFHPDAIERIAAYAEGIPRVLNQLCEAALRISSRTGIATVSPPVVDAAARQLDLRISRRPSSAWAVIRTSATGIGVAILVSVTAALFVFWPTSHPPSSLLPAIGPVAVEQTNPPAQVTLPEPLTVAPDSETRIPAETPSVVRPAPPAAPVRVKRPTGTGWRRAPGPSARVGTHDRMPAPKMPSVSVPAVTTGVAPPAPALLANAEVGNLTGVRALLVAGASPDTRDAMGMTPLMVAVVHDHGTVAELLLARGADVDARDDGGVTALMLAANNGRTALLQGLIARGANVNAQTKAGWTALTYAAWKGYPGVARRLLAAGADPTLTDRLGWTALQYARWRAADGPREKALGVSDPVSMDYQDSVEAAHGRYTELVDLLLAARKPGI